MNELPPLTAAEVLDAVLKTIDYRAGDVKMYLVDKGGEGLDVVKYTLRDLYRNEYNSLVILREWMREGQLRVMLQSDWPPCTERIFKKDGT